MGSSIRGYGGTRCRHMSRSKLLEYADAPPLIMPTKAPVGSANEMAMDTVRWEARTMGRRLLSRPGSGPMWCRNVRQDFFTAAIKLPMGDHGTAEQMWRSLIWRSATQWQYPDHHQSEHGDPRWIPESRLKPFMVRASWRTSLERSRCRVGRRHHCLPRDGYL